ncbi:MAG: FAD-dependent oxidoreductase, partial [Chloroflexota bacterium]
MTRSSVVVIGGGIAGIQASLDLANMGFHVHLVEKLPSVGGRMAQLDKTFPTNDCAMCILAPKMMEASTHPNITLLTYSEVEDVRGDVGNFTVTIRRKAPFVDWDKCTGCGLCVEGCPVLIPNEFDQKLGTRKAIYMLFPQAVPKKCTIDKREDRPCKAACMDACPVHTNVSGYVRLIKEGQFKEAYKLIRETNPFPASIARVCYAPCEAVCNRGQLDDSIAIRDLKRVPADRWDMEQLEVPIINPTGRNVAVIGAGPAGLACANDLALKGHGVTVYEALPDPGGMLRVAIPGYRLPKDILAKEIAYIQKLGVDIRTGVTVGKDVALDELKNEYDAVFIGTGAHGSVKLGVEGEDSPGIMEGLSFLRDITLGKKVKVGKKVAVIGGGNTAIDCARTALRSGGKQVSIFYRRSQAEMPASDEEVRAAQEEGIEIEFLTSPTRFVSENGKLSAMECTRMELGEPDASGRARPVPVKGSEFSVPVDTVIAAVGQVPQTEFTGGLGISLSKRGTIGIDLPSGATNVEGIFAGGDVVTGPAFAIDAIAAGKKAADSIHRYLSGEPPRRPLPEREPEQLVEQEIKELQRRFPSLPRIGMPHASGDKRAKDFSEVAQGYTAEQAFQEASRCLASQIEGCIQCHECERRCEPDAIRYEMQDETMEVEAGAIILASGLDVYDVSPLSEYGYGRVKNVITGMEFERLTAASGPTFGELRRPSDGKVPSTIGFIQCVASRDFRYKPYCSSVCCMHGTKEAMLAYEHHPGT